MSARRRLIGIVGPTGSGKSELALRVAEVLGGEIVSCDALQVYRGLDIGTAKLSPAERRGIPHHLLDVVEPSNEFSAADYIALAAPVVHAIAERGRVPIVVGGTGLYYRALTKGLFEGPGRVPAIRARLRRIVARRGPETLHRLLRRWDPDSAARIHPNDIVRVERALEVRIETGRPMSALQAERKSPISEFDAILLGLEPEREDLARRIALRVRRMFERGLVSEVLHLRQVYGEDAPAFKAIGYRETLDHLAGTFDRLRAEQLVTLATTQYAKRQLTWFRREEGIVWFRGSGDDPTVASRVIAFLQQRANSSNQESLHAETAS